MQTRIAEYLEPSGRFPGMALALFSCLAMVGGLVTAEEQEEADHVVVRRPVVVVKSGSHHPGDAWIMGGHRAFLGVQTVDLTPELREHFQVPREAGVLVARIVEGGPAQESGLQVGDIISAVDDEDITTPAGLARTVGHHDSGDVIDLEVWRQGRLERIEATLAQRRGPAVDIRQFHLPAGHLVDVRVSADELEGAIELEAETLNQAIERLNEELDSPEWHARVHSFKEHQGTLMKRIEALEQQLKELEAELEDLADGDD